MAEKGEIVELSVSVILTEEMSDTDAMAWAGRSVDHILNYGEGLGALILRKQAKRLCTGVSIGRNPRMGPRHHRLNWKAD